LDGKVVWASNAGETFGLGPFVMVGDLILALNDAGKLRLVQAGESSCEVLGEIQPLNGREAWAPMALAGNRLLLRDLARLVCLELPGR
jgi:outer membrane protein assembly factor BamB